MASVQNKNLKFEDAGQVRKIVSDYVDPNKNVWRITAIGAEATVNYFQEQKGLTVIAESADKERSLPVPEPREYRGTGEPAEEKPRTPELELRIDLIKLSVEPPYRISFLIDPPLKPNAWHTYYVNIEGDTQTSVTFSADYLANVSLYPWSKKSNGGSSTGVFGSVNCNGTGYTIYVTNQTANQNDYSLSGDINVG